jgi:hypothetical protein
VTIVTSLYVNRAIIRPIMIQYEWVSVVLCPVSNVLDIQSNLYIKATRYCTKITLKSPNPRETSERMNFNVIDKKTINLKTVYILISANLVFSCVARFNATTEQKLIHSFWNALRIRRKINQLHQSLCYTSSIYYTKQSLDFRNQ